MVWIKVLDVLWTLMFCWYIPKLLQFALTLQLYKQGSRPSLT